MSFLWSRRRFFQTSLTGVAVGFSGLRSARAILQEPNELVLTEPDLTYPHRSTASLVKGADRRKSVYEALVEIDDLISPRLSCRKYVVIKPNNVSTVKQLASTHVDALRGILDYLETRFRGPVVIAESSAGNTWDGFESFLYTRLCDEYRSPKVSLIDLNKEAKYEVLHILDGDMHLTPVRLAARLLDPDAFVINTGPLKTHNVVVATLSVKNMTLGAPLHQAPGESVRWNDKRKYHGGVRQTHFAILQTAQRMQPYWGVSVLDGYEGMEGNGPSSGSPVPSRVAIASTDFVAADRVGVETMGIDASWLAYLIYCWQAGLGQYDLGKIDIRGDSIADVRKTYRLHGEIEQQLMWQGPMLEVPPKLG
jgi:uncharacterized protein (DUF362 family)